MSLRVHRLAGWLIGEELYYFGGAGAPVGVVSDAAGTLTVELDGTVDRSIFNPSNNPAQLAKVWHLFQQVSIEDWGAGSASCQLFEFNVGGVLYRIDAVRTDAATYTLQVRRVAVIKGEGTTELSWGHGNKYDIRFSSDGTNHILEYGAAGALATEVTYADAAKLSQGMSIDVDNVSGDGDTMEMGGYAGTSGDTGADRPDTQMSFVKAVPSSVTGTHHSDWADFNHLDVDDWQAGNQDGDATFDGNTGVADTTEEASYLTDDGAGSNPAVANMRALYMSASIRSTALGKDLTGRLFACDGANDDMGATPIPIVTEGYMVTRLGAIFNDAPDGGPWAPADLNALELGIESVVGEDQVSLRLSAIQGEAMGVALDPAPVAARRVLIM